MVVKFGSDKLTKDEVFTCLNGKYDMKDLNKFRKKYLPDCMGKSTTLIVNKIVEQLKK